MSKIVYVRESFLQAVLSDCFTGFMLCGSFWFNEAYIGSGFMNGLILVMIFLVLVSKTKTKTFDTNEEVIKYLQNIEDRK